MTPITILLVAVLSVGRCPAQSIGANVSGIVTDETGARIPDATVTITHVLNGRALEVKTGREGDYRAVALLPGEYDIKVCAADSGRQHDAWRCPWRRCDGKSGAVARGRRGADDRECGNVARRSRAIPALVDRHEAAKSKSCRCSTGISWCWRNCCRDRARSTGRSTGWPRRSSAAPADQRAGYTTLIDGGDINDTVWGSPTINVGADAVQEFKVFRHQFDAQYGHALTAVVTVATRSGTNRFSGSGFYFGRDDALNARYAFATETLPFDEQRVGGSIGGPLVRDRSHFFVSYERDNVDTVRVIALPCKQSICRPARMASLGPKRTISMASARLDHRFGARSLVGPLRIRPPAVTAGGDAGVVRLQPGRHRQTDPTAS